MTAYLGRCLMYAEPEQILIIFVPPRCRPKAPWLSQAATLVHAIIVAGRIVVRRRPICGGPPYRARSPCPRARFLSRGRASRWRTDGEWLARATSGGFLGDAEQLLSPCRLRSTYESRRRWARRGEIRHDTRGTETYTELRLLNAVC